MASETHSGFVTIKEGLVKPSIKMLSDSVAISYKPNPNLIYSEPELAGDLIANLCTAVAKILTYFIESNPPLLLRGCITYGKHMSEGNFLIGPAVDEAAMKMNIPDGAFIWLAPRAEKLYKRFIRFRMEQIVESTDWEIRLSTGDNEELFQQYKFALWLLKNTGSPPSVIEKYQMPIKGEKTLVCSVLNPLVGYLPEKRKEVTWNYLNEMRSRKLDIVSKRRNTKEFLKVAERFCQDYDKTMEKFITSNKDNIENGKFD